MAIELQNFEEEVLKASQFKPVLVDFWAPWCGPCRTLGPIIEKLALEHQDKWTLVKINSDQHPDLSSRYDVKGIPAVKLFHKGRVIDEFTGVLPEYAIVQWLEKALPSKAKELIRAAESALELEEESKARQLLEEALLLEPTNATASGLLASLVVFDQLDRAAELAKTAATGEPRFLQLNSAIQEIAAYANEDRLNALEAEKGADAYRLAIEEMHAGHAEQAILALIEVLKVNRYLDDDGSRKLGVALFTLLGPSHPLTQKHRRTFDMWLY
jgi:putative thioredoxin